MPTNSPFSYFHGTESEQFSYYRIPRLLITGKQFRHLSTDAKLLYGLLLDRMGLSARNGWYDELSRVYIYYPLEEIQEAMNCGHEKAVKLLAELDAGKGIGLIERVKQGQGKPAKIYVKQFTSKAMPEPPEEPVPQKKQAPSLVQQTPVPEQPVLPAGSLAEAGSVPQDAFPTQTATPAQPLPTTSNPQREGPTYADSRLRISGSQDFCQRQLEPQTSEKPKSRLPIFRSQEFGKSEVCYYSNNYPDNSYLDPSIYPSEGSASKKEGYTDRCDEIDEMGMKEKLKAQIGYTSLVSQYRPEKVDGLIALMTDILSSPQATFRISGCQIRASSVRDRMRTLEQPHIEYVLDCMKKNTTKIRNIRSYLLTALYNAPVTMEHYYQAEVQHDLYGQ